MNYSNSDTWIGKDFQGWPICKRTFKELFEDLKLVSDNGDIHIPSNHPILDAFPIRLTDDGMGYGINKEFFTCASFENNNLIFFTEPYNKIEVEKLKEWEKEYRKKVLEIQNTEYDYGHNVEHSSSEE